MDTLHKEDDDDNNNIIISKSFRQYLSNKLGTTGGRGEKQPYWASHTYFVKY